MKARDRKLLRDMRLMWSQALTIALVVAAVSADSSPASLRGVTGAGA